MGAKQQWLSLLMVLLVLMLAAYLILISNKQFTLNEMDVDGSGVISFSEALMFMDAGKRAIAVPGQVCTEYYAYKDGLAFKTECTVDN